MPVKFARVWILASLSFGGSSALASPYRGAGLRDMSFRLARAQNVQLELWLGVDVTVSIADGLDARAYAGANLFVDALIDRTWDIVGDVLRGEDVWRLPCRSDSYNLNVFMVDALVLEDRSRFRHMYDDPRMHVLPGHVIFGYYDPTPEIVNESLIVLGVGSVDAFAALGAHELGHYWWDRMCLEGRLVGWTSESFAGHVQDTFTRLYGR